MVLNEWLNLLNLGETEFDSGLILVFTQKEGKIQAKDSFELIAIANYMI